MSKHNFFQTVANLLETLSKFAQQPITLKSPRRTRRLVEQKFNKKASQQISQQISQQLAPLLQEMAQFRQGMNAKALYWRLWRSVLLSYRQAKNEGFVLPVTVLMVLMVMLVVSSLIFRAYQRSVETIGDYQQQQVENAAAPAIERGKAKIEYLMRKQVPNVIGPDVPEETKIETLVYGNDPDLPDPDKLYRFEDEQWLTNGDFIGDDIPSNWGWTFETDTNGDGDTDDPEDLITAYTVVLRSTRQQDSDLLTIDPQWEDTPDYQVLDEEERDDYWLVTNGTLVNQTNDDPLCQPRYEEEPDPNAAKRIEGWFDTNSTALVNKNFQVYAVSVSKGSLNGGSANPVISTLQYQQDRVYERANKYGAWFRTDIELYNGPPFIWNGAMHSEGTLFLRGRDGFRSFLISDEESCYYSPKLNSDLSYGKEGQLAYRIPSATTAEGNQKGALIFDIYNEAEHQTTVVSGLGGGDSSEDSVIASNPIDISLNPLKILIANESEPRKPENVADDPNWNEENQEAAKRISKEPMCPPYIDDIYRADNRYGPKPTYKATVENDEGKCDPQIDTNEAIGNPLSDADLIENEPPDAQPDQYGLDGYWERRARGQGLRVIVGQRLELGNAFGWTQDLDGDGINDDPLNLLDETITHEKRQRRTLRDNLAAVQATAVYHFNDGSKGYEPIAVVATTVHPGSEQSLKDSSTFETIKINGKDYIAIDFFNGYGTNGWEFEPPTVTSTTLGSSTDLGKALRNLAMLAGDYDSGTNTGGAYPPTQDDVVHPYPQLTMWGNFSNLRRIFETTTSTTIAPPSSGNAGAISLADATTLHTAASMLGMLAYNIDYLEAYDYSQNQTSGLGGGVKALGDALWKLQDGIADNGEVVDLSGGTPGAIEYNLPPDAYIGALETYKNELSIDDDVIKLARLIMTKEQVKRDRTYGFKLSPDNHSGNGAPYTVQNDLDNGNDAIGEPIDTDYVLESACDISTGTGNDYFALGADPLNAEQEQRFIGLSRLCSNHAKFPSLYYIFPKVVHDRDGDTSTVDGVNGIDHTQPTAEPYIKDTYIQGLNTQNYQVVDISKVKIEPRNINDWILPQTSSGFTVTDAEAAPNDSSHELIKFDGENYKVALKDSALYDGREAMVVRVLNLDLEMLRTESSTDIGAETWLREGTETAIVYAFREDAVREDAIARPASTGWNAYESSYLSDPAGMDATDLNNPQDPPLSEGPDALPGISPKPVDYLADPDRRPYGFRLKNGRFINRGDSKTHFRGMTFVTDSPVYIQGAFNLHTSKDNATENEIQEFTKQFVPSLSGQLNEGTDWDFYNREQLNEDFANPTVDKWRPTEILADAVTILSDNFCDGSIEDGMIYADTANPDPKGSGELGKSDRKDKYGCNTGSDYTSYLNQNRPKEDSTWFRENPWENTSKFSGTATSPIEISNNGEIQIEDSNGGKIPYAESFSSFTDGLNKSHRRGIAASETTVNLVLVAGVVPFRENQLNGGLHNFPRMLEDWQNKTKLNIQGSLMQLYYSNYGTAPFDQTPWEPGDPMGKNNFAYYQPPQRIWGYDLGLQYLPAGPASSRMVIANTSRNEFYREPPADDAYICRLRQAIGFDCK